MAAGAVNLSSALFLTVVLSATLILRRFLTKRTKVYCLLVAQNIVLCLLSGLSYAGMIGRAWLMVAFVIQYGMIANYSWYLLSTLEEQKPVRYLMMWVTIPLCLASLIAFLISMRASGFADPFALANRNRYMVAFGLAMLALVFNQCVLVHWRKYLTALEFWYLFLLPVAPLILSEIARYYTEIPLRQLFLSGANILVYVHLHVADDRLLSQQKEQLLHDRLALSINRMRPHFIFNSLTAIYALCDTDPEKAKTAIHDFSHYLRTNLELIDRDKLIPFPQELEHVRQYLDLEQLRFGDRIKVQYDIRARDFLIPTLTVQPVAENAIKHGIAPLEQGGTLTIFSEETEGEYIVRISNDGVRFEPEKLSHRDPKHMSIGFDMAKDRVAMLSGGTIEIRALNEQRGTVVEIRLPKNSKQKQLGGKLGA